MGKKRRFNIFYFPQSLSSLFVKWLFFPFHSHLFFLFSFVLLLIWGVDYIGGSGVRPVLVNPEVVVNLIGKEPVGICLVTKNEALASSANRFITASPGAGYTRFVT